MALLIEQLERKLERPRSVSGGESDECTSEEIDSEEQTSEDLGPQDCTSGGLALTTKTRLASISKILEQLKTVQAKKNPHYGSSGPTANCHF